MKIARAALTACIIPLSLSLAACGSSSETSTQKPTSSSDSSTLTSEERNITANDTGATSPRGNRVLQIGEPVTLTVGGDQKKLADFTVKKITKDFHCTEKMAGKPANGHYVAIEIQAETGDRAVFNQAFYDVEYADLKFGDSAWRFVDKSGTTINSITSAGSDLCLPQSEYIKSVGPSKNVNGLVILDLPSTQGTLVLVEWFSQEKWEIEIPK